MEFLFLIFALLSALFYFLVSSHGIQTNKNKIIIHLIASSKLSGKPFHLGTLKKHRGGCSQKPTLWEKTGNHYYGNEGKNWKRLQNKLLHFIKQSFTVSPDFLPYSFAISKWLWHCIICSNFKRITNTTISVYTQDK